jgi:hypothetical protein
MFRRPLNVASVILTLWFSSVVFGEENTRFIESVRFRGRGNTFVAAFDSDEATRANPATLRQGPVQFQLRPLQFDGFIGSNAISMVSDLTNVAQSADTSATKVLQAFTDHFGKRQYIRAQGNFRSCRIKSFEFSPFFTSHAFVDMRIPSTPTLELEAEYANGLNMAWAMALSNSVEFGINLKYMNRATYHGEAAFADVLDVVDVQSKTLTDVFESRQGTQAGADLGLIWHPTKESRYGMTIENVGYTGNIGSTGKLPLRAIRQNVSLGWLRRFGSGPWYGDLSVDAQDIINSPILDPMRQLHLGLEWGRRYVSRDLDIGFQLGMNEGYLSSGLFLDLWALRLHMAYYAVELGEYSGQRKDRRWAFGAQVFTFTF